MQLPRRRAPSRAAEVEAWLTSLSERTLEQLAREGEAASREGETRPVEPPPARARRRRGLSWLAGSLAAALVVAWMTWFLRDTAPGIGSGDRIPLGSERLRLLRPLGDARSFDEFEWDGVPPEGGSIQLLLGSRLRPDEPIVRAWAAGSSWRPSHEEASRLPDDLWWEVRFLDKLGLPVDSRHGEATLVRD